MPDEILDAGEKLNFKTEKHVSWMFSALGFLAFLILVFSLSTGTLAAAIPFLIIGIIIFTIYKGVVLHPEAKYYIRYSNILGIRVQKKIPYDHIEYAFITRYKQGQTMHYFSMQTNASFTEFIGWIRFSEKHKLPLLVRDSKAEIETEMEKLAAYLKTKVLDYSDK